MKRLLFLFVALLCYNAQSQSLVVYNIDPTTFPTIKAKFYAFDANDKPMTNLSPTNFEVTENWQSRNVTLVSCPPLKPPQALSSVLVIDISSSMEGERLRLAKEAARVWIEGLPPGSECAITAFDDRNYLVQDFTMDKTRLLAGVEALAVRGGTNYSAALLDPPAGGLVVMTRGRFKRVIVFLTDGMPMSEPQTARIIQEARQQNVTIYGVTLGMPCPSIIKEITTQTGGLWYENVTTEVEARRVYLQLLQISQGVEPCEIQWQSDVPCTEGDTRVEITLLPYGNTVTTHYQSPSTVIASIEFDPPSVRFDKPVIGVRQDATVRVTARNAAVTVTGVTSINPRFSLTPSRFSLAAGQSINVTVSYTPTDSSNQFSIFEFENNLCPTSYYASGGWRGKTPSTPTLRVVHPNGGEHFVVGSDTVIVWEGISPSDTVRLDYSIDNGKRWKNLTHTATGLRYVWRNIPRPASTECLVRARQVEHSDTVPSILWQRALGGYGDEGPIIFNTIDIIECRDSTVVVVGQTWSNDGDVRGKHGEEDAWVVKLRPTDGSIIWQKPLGGYKADWANSIIESSDGSYVVAGYTKSTDGDVSGNHGGGDCWVVKLRPDDGSIIWQKTFGGSDYDVAHSIIESKDGSYVVAGETRSTDGDVSGNHGLRNFWVVKLDSTDGSIIWQKALGGTSEDVATSVIESSDGYYVVAGWAGSNNWDVRSNHGARDFWVVKLRPNDGSIVWQKTLGGSNNDEAFSLIESSDGSYVVAGRTSSTDGDVRGNHGNSDVWIVKIRPTDGSIMWQKTLGGSADEGAHCIIESSDGSYVVAGYTYSADGDVRTNHGAGDYWVVKLRPDDGSIVWQRTFGGSDVDEAYSIIESNDGHYVVAGQTWSTDGDVSGNHGKSDLWVVKLSEDGAVLQSDVSDSVFAIVEPQSTARDIDMRECLVGSVKDSVVTPFLENIGSWAFRVDSISFRGADAAAFSIVSGIPPYVVPPQGSYPCEFRFRPLRPGVHTAQVVIYTQADTLVQTIRGIGVQPQLEVVSSLIDFGQVEVGTVKDTLQVLTVRNIGSAPLTITATRHGKPNDTDFVTIAGGGAFTLQPNQTWQMDLRFRPSAAGRTSGTLEFDYNGVGSPAVVLLLGNGVVKASAALAAGIVEGRPGDTVEVPIVLTEERDVYASGAEWMHVELSYNPTLLYPLDYKQRISTDGNGSIVVDSLPARSASAGQEVARVRCLVGLGNAEECDLVLSNAGSDNGMVDISVRSGRFHLLGVCREGGARLINPTTRTVLHIAPNPTGNEIEIDLSISEIGWAEVVLYSVDGRNVKEIFGQEIRRTDVENTGVYHTRRQVSAGDIPPGVYLVVFRTPTYVQSQPLLVVR